MDAESAFLLEIAATPDDDVPRLVFADWLEDNNQPARAELIRTQCRLDPDRDRFDDEQVNALRDRVEELLRPLEKTEDSWLHSLSGRYSGIRPQWRRGFVDSIELPVQDLLRHGRELRQRYPLLQKLVIFRLNGWGERLACCEWLRGIPEIEFPCWYSEEDVLALTESPHLEFIERIVYWSDENDLLFGTHFARGKAWPNLRNLHMVVGCREADQHWSNAVNGAAGRPIASVYDFNKELFPFAPDFFECFIIGKLPDGTQLYLSSGPGSEEAEGIAFDPDGTPREGLFHFRFPPEIIHLTQTKGEEWSEYRTRRERTRLGYLRQQIGFIPAMIRVKYVPYRDCGPSRYRSDVEDQWGRLDDPAWEPGPNEWDVRGYGGAVYDWVTEGGYVYDAGEAWWCDRSGHVIST